MCCFCLFVAIRKKIRIKIIWKAGISVVSLFIISLNNNSIAFLIKKALKDMFNIVLVGYVDY
ncbi:hypothetical protein SAMN04488023_104168 [Pedobacter rhizosphaerae]|uniref:Uncharacterized protein n=1 Tax=Pedobacter rhizosphaerae TaxID=390241 RepID=A0A1H9LJ33_9SPHI|nr:hypothetical protein SAMN04488023_104168 [Pedobacter rhizosphaerae]